MSFCAPCRYKLRQHPPYIHPALQEDKLITVSSVVTPAQFARGQNVGRGSTVIAAVTLKSIILTLALYKGEDGVLLL